MKLNSQILDKKLELIQWLSSIEDKEIIEKLILFRKEETKDWWDSVSDEERNSIDNGIKDADSKKLRPSSTFHETNHLLSTKANTKRLKRSINEVSLRRK